MIVGGVHGDDPAGVAAIEQLRASSRPSPPIRGRLLTVIANRSAVRRGRRAIDFDLNRAFGSAEAHGHEAAVAKILAPELARADFVLDLHSTSSSGPVFAAGAHTTRHVELCRSLGVGLYSFGWSEPRAHTMLVDEADRCGAIGILVECGQHGAPDTVETALRCSRSALSALGMTRSAGGEPAAPMPRIARVGEIVKATRGTFRLLAKYRNFDQVRKGEMVGMDGDRPWKAPADFLIMIPAQGPVGVGEDAFAVGQWVDGDAPASATRSPASSSSPAGTARSRPPRAGPGSW